jgi:uncharacterized protein YhbP (UPF0306 family)
MVCGQNCSNLEKGGDMNTDGLRGLGAIEDFAVQRPDFATKAWVGALLRRNRVVVLATTDGAKPWVAPLEYMTDEDLNLYFFSPTETQHVQHLEANATVAATVMDHTQPIVTPTATVFLNGVQMECTATRIPPEGMTDALKTAAEGSDISIPPYSAFKIVPHRVYVPSFQDGVHLRIEVDMT